MFGWLAHASWQRAARESEQEDLHLFEFDQTHILTAILSRDPGGGFWYRRRFRLVSGQPHTANNYGPVDLDRHVPAGGLVPAVRLAPGTFHQLFRDRQVARREAAEALRLSRYPEHLFPPQRRRHVHNFNYTQSSPGAGLPILPILGMREVTWKRLLAACGLIATVVAWRGLSPKNEIRDPHPRGEGGHPLRARRRDDQPRGPAYDGWRTNTKKPMRLLVPGAVHQSSGDQYASVTPPSRSSRSGAEPHAHPRREHEDEHHHPAERARRRRPCPGQTERFVTAYNFVVACAGHVGAHSAEERPLASPPDPGRLLRRRDGARARRRRVRARLHARVHFDTRRNTVPVLDGVMFEGQPVDMTAGVKTGKCVKDKNGQCKTVKFNVSFPTRTRRSTRTTWTPTATSSARRFTSTGSRRTASSGAIARSSTTATSVVPSKTDVEYEPRTTPSPGEDLGHPPRQPRRNGVAGVPARDPVTCPLIAWPGTSSRARRSPWGDRRDERDERRRPQLEDRHRLKPPTRRFHRGVAVLPATADAGGQLQT